MWHVMARLDSDPLVANCYSKIRNNKQLSHACRNGMAQRLLGRHLNQLTHCDVRGRCKVNMEETSKSRKCERKSKSRSFHGPRNKTSHPMYITCTTIRSYFKRLTSKYTCWIEWILFY